VTALAHIGPFPVEELLMVVSVFAVAALRR
jgi:hypothetical protein